MTKIEERLKRLRDTDDLSYSEKPIDDSSSGEGRRQIDDATLA